jgi:hypothetical protein
VKNLWCKEAKTLTFNDIFSLEAVFKQTKRYTYLDESPSFFWGKLLPLKDIDEFYRLFKNSSVKLGVTI